MFYTLTVFSILIADSYKSTARAASACYDIAKLAKTLYYTTV